MGSLWSSSDISFRGFVLHHSIPLALTESYYWFRVTHHHHFEDFPSVPLKMHLLFLGSWAFPVLGILPYFCRIHQTSSIFVVKSWCEVNFLQWCISEKIFFFSIRVSWIEYKILGCQWFMFRFLKALLHCRPTFILLLWNLILFWFSTIYKLILFSFWKILGFWSFFAPTLLLYVSPGKLVALQIWKF